MAPTKVILLACGSFNPPTNMHMRMFEIARDHLHRMGNYVVIGGLISPVHDGYGKKELEPATHRLNMIRLALQSTDWVKLSDWECKQETWSRTKQVLQYHQNHVNSLMQRSDTVDHQLNEDDAHWIPENVRNTFGDPIEIKLLCGADLLESFGTPGLWSNDDIEAIVGQHGLIVITRSHSNPNEFIYNSDVLTKYLSNIVIVTEWIQNEVSSTKIRRALSRSESVKYLLPEKVIDYIYKHKLFGSKDIKYFKPEYNLNFLTPSPSDVQMESPIPTNCMIICNNALFSRNYDKGVDTVDSVNKTNLLNTVRHPGQAVKIITEKTGGHKIIKDAPGKQEVCKDAQKMVLKNSKSCANIDEIHNKNVVKSTRSNASLKECKSCDENLIKFIFTKHGIQVISDVETIV